MSTVVNKSINELFEKQKELDIHKTGKEYINSMSEEEKSKIRSKCGTLHLVKLLKLQSERADRMVAGGDTKVCHKAVGVVLYSDEDITVPDIPGHYTKDTGIPSEAIKSRKVKANEEFFLTYYEFMFLMFRPEYAGFCSRGDDPYGVYFSVKMPKFLKEDGVKLPTPTVNYTKAGSPKEVMDAVDYYDKEKKAWCIKPEFEEKFGSYISRVTPQRKQNSKDDFPTSTKAALGLAKVLKDKYNYEI